MCGHTSDIVRSRKLKIQASPVTAAPAAAGPSTLPDVELLQTFVQCVIDYTADLESQGADISSGVIIQRRAFEAEHCFESVRDEGATIDLLVQQGMLEPANSSSECSTFRASSKVRQRVSAISAGVYQRPLVSPPKSRPPPTQSPVPAPRSEPLGSVAPPTHRTRVARHGAFCSLGLTAVVVFTHWLGDWLSMADDYLIVHRIVTIE